MQVDTCKIACVPKRFAAAIVDLMIVFAAIAALSSTWPNLSQLWRTALAWLLLEGTLLSFYQAAFESSSLQATPGKLLLGLNVTDIHGNRVRFPRALARNLSKVFCQISSGAGYAICFDNKHQGLHDLIANCLVIEKPKRVDAELK